MNALNSTLISVLILSAQVYLLRVAGYWVAGHFRFNRFVKLWLEYLPGCVMISVVSPILLAKDMASYVACGAVVLTMLATKNLFLAMIVGTGLVMGCHFLHLL